MASCAASISTFDCLSVCRHRRQFCLTTSTPIFGNPIKFSPQILFSLSSNLHRSIGPISSRSSDADSPFSDELNPKDEVAFNPPTPPEDFDSAPYFDEGPMETEEEIGAAYEERYGCGYSGVSYLGNDIFEVNPSRKLSGFGLKFKREKIRDGFEERVVEVRRVTKVVKGGKNVRFRVIVVVGDKKGQVGVGIGKAREVIDAVHKSALNARRDIVTVPLTKYKTFPHRADGDYGAAKVMLRPACPGSGVLAGGSVKAVLEMAGVESALGKQLGSNNPLNNARATLVAVQQMRHFRDVARQRGIPMEELWK